MKGKNTITTGLRSGGRNETETPNNFIRLWTLMSAVAHVCVCGGETVGDDLWVSPQGVREKETWS